MNFLPDGFSRLRSKFRALTAVERSKEANIRLAAILAFVAGAVNAGGFLAIHRYTSHMSGIVSYAADELALGDYVLAVSGLGAVAAFVAGSMCCAILVNWGRRARLHSQYAVPLLLEGCLLAIFFLVGKAAKDEGYSAITVATALLCFIMGLQNAVITKISNAEIRTTHVTGMITDLGIELGKLVYCNGSRTAAPKVAANRSKMGVLATLVMAFFVGGVTGAVGYRILGFSFSLPLAFVVFTISCVPVIDDISRIRRN